VFALVEAEETVRVVVDLYFSGPTKPDFYPDAKRAKDLLVELFDKEARYIVTSLEQPTSEQMGYLSKIIELDRCKDLRDITPLKGALTEYAQRLTAFSSITRRSFELLSPTDQTRILKARSQGRSIANLVDSVP
jgi:hypothetical protein